MEVSALERFLRAGDLDAAAVARDLVVDLSAADLERVARAVDGAEGPQARANLLMHPSVLPAARRGEALESGLREGPRSYAALAAAVGLDEVDVGDLGERRAGVVAALLDLVEADTGLVATRAAAASFGLLTAPEAAEAVPLLVHPTAQVRRALLGAVLHAVGPTGLRAVLDSPGFADPDVTDEVRRAFEADGFVLDDAVAPLPSLSFLPNLADWRG
ncbi:hypothetical protein [Nocardioides sp. 1609]|uniref:hypothetical protein n=1 Tax=Nocardioides sp. 1609 TaxID=2508327 RepID=UPI00106F0C9E|nr:hypothetical protein [Nocardioides sp. 1609]